MDRDTIIVNFGPEGEGKSVCGFQVCIAINPNFKAEHVAFTAKDAIELAKVLPRGSVIMLDEATEGAYSRDAMTAKNKDFNKFLMVCRERQHYIIINFPSWSDVDSYVKKRCHYAVLIQRRGLALAHAVPRRDYVKSDGELHDMFRFRFNKPDHPEWERILKRKADYVTKRDTGEEDGSSGGSVPEAWYRAREQLAGGLGN